MNLLVPLAALCRGRRPRNRDTRPSTERRSPAQWEKSQAARRETLPPEYSSVRTDSLPAYQHKPRRQKQKQQPNPTEEPSVPRHLQSTKPLNDALIPDDRVQHSDIEQHALAHYDYVYAIIVQSPDGTTRLRRQMVLPFNVDVDIMCDETCRRLGAPIQPYYGAALTAIPGYPDLKPVGTAEVEWSFCGQCQTHRTTFHVVRDLDADFVLGRPTIRHLELERMDSAVAERLHASEVR
ncbi:uncharacterized protein BO66DRAFT_393782 [Aspergillus aculeatinus CBS 121060]|uniref:Uncharacterized protein n=1 Tax=Aspergillus aculeatinus CBS 121060 TaxID=1448322 RepID=A0ACD1H213_9EURO|nr:hypothetical protein BO66DRAFT_393782 [Aspergillus aculeatinus CBS 121060]RAH67572.1 hypothetical protein BO66DRAFT_393782 [Aspergillus aculeatinus CBS 121060]